MRRKKMYRRSAGQWQKIIDDYAGSGLSIDGYCRKCGVSDKSFYAWRNRLSKGTGRYLKDFIEVSGQGGSNGRSLRIQTPCGYRLDVPEGTNGIFVKNIITALVSK